MELREKVSLLPLGPGVYLYKDGAAAVIYVGKAKSLRARVRSYFNDDKLADVKTGTLISEARDIDHIFVDNEKEALALENNLIKQYKPRFNILLRDDKTYPYIKLTSEKYPRVYVTRRLIKDGSTYFGPYFPGNLAHRTVNFIHRHFKIPFVQGGPDAICIRSRAWNSISIAVTGRVSRAWWRTKCMLQAVRDVLAFSGRPAYGTGARPARADGGGIAGNALRGSCRAARSPLNGRGD